MSLFSNRNILLLTQGSLINQIGTQVAIVTTIFWIKSATNSASLIGLVTAATALPAIVLSPVGGVFADRWFRRNSLIICDTLCGLVSLGIVFLLGSGFFTIREMIVGVVCGKLLLSSASAFAAPAFSAFIPDLVEPEYLSKANALSQSGSLIATICGQALAGILLTRFAPPVLFAMDGATYFLSSLAVFLINPPDVSSKPQAERDVKRIWSEMKEGTRYIWQRRGMRVLLMASIPLNIFTAPIFVFLPFYTTNALHEPLSRFGYLLATFSLGMLAGYVQGGRTKTTSAYAHYIVLGCIIGTGAAALVISQLHSLSFALVMLFLMGFLAGVALLLSINALIIKTPTDKRGRIAGVLVMVGRIAPLAMSVFGLLGDKLNGNVRPIYAGCAVMLLVLGSTLLFNADLRRFFTGTDRELSAENGPSSELSPSG
jgi:MFS transporter, DHA3 family, macrolide efflux protein